MSTFNNARTAIAHAALTVTSKRLDDLRSSDRQLRCHSKRQIKQLARSIETFGFNVPVLVSADNTVIAGQGRVLACRELGWSEIPTICIGHLSDAQVKAFMIADNRLNELSTWNDQMLGETLRELSLLNLDFAVEATGFDTGEIDFRIEALTKSKDKASRDDVVCEVPQGSADGEEMPFADVKLFSPDNETVPVVHGRADVRGRVAFVPSRDGLWTLVASDGDGHSVRAPIPVTLEAAAQTSAAPGRVSLELRLVLFASVVTNVILGLLAWRRLSTGRHCPA